MKIINLTDQKYPIKKKNIDVYDELMYPSTLENFRGILRWKKDEVITSEAISARLMRIWKKIPVYLVTEDQANKTIEYKGTKILVPDFRDPYFSIDERLNYAEDPEEIQRRYFDGVEKMDNEEFKEDDATMLKNFYVNKEFFGKDYLPKGCVNIGNGMRRWVAADSFSVYVRDYPHGKAYGENATKPMIFIRMDKITERARCKDEWIETNVILEILKCRFLALMDIDIFGHKGTRERNYDLRMLQPAYFRLKENALALTYAVGEMSCKTTDEDMYEKFFSCSGCFSEWFAAMAYMDDYNNLGKITKAWIDSKTDYAAGVRGKGTDIYKSEVFVYAYDSVTGWYREVTSRNLRDEELAEELRKYDLDFATYCSQYSATGRKGRTKLSETVLTDNFLQENVEASVDRKAESKEAEYTPQAIKDYLDRHVIGQDDAKRYLAVAVYNHYKRVDINRFKREDEKLQKSNVILIGETGCGKTLLAKTIAQMLNVPIFIQDCTKITQAGYVGADVEECLNGLLVAAKYDVTAAEKGIVVLDEVDKIAARSTGTSADKDVGGEGVQQSLLKLVEGDNVQVNVGGGRRRSDSNCRVINTSDILFICTGAFAGIENIVRKRRGCTKVGFGNTGENMLRDKEGLTGCVTPEDFRQFGMIPEFIGRFPIIANVNKLTEDDLVRVLTEPANSMISQYTELLAEDKTDVVFEPEALKAIAHAAIEMRTGARGLKGVIETVLRDIMFDAPANKFKPERTTVTIDGEYVLDKLNNHYSFC